MNKTTGQLQENFRLNASSLSKYQEVKRWIFVNYSRTKQICSKDPTRDPAAMEIGRVSKGKESKGKHKGKRTKMQLFASNAEARDTWLRNVLH